MILRRNKRLLENAKRSAGRCGWAVGVANKNVRRRTDGRWKRQMAVKALAGVALHVRPDAQKILAPQPREIFLSKAPA